MIEWFENMEKRHLENDLAIKAAKEKLLADPCMDVPETGDSILISAAFLMRGHIHELLECRVVEVSNTAYKIAVKKCYDKEEYYHWIPSELVREVIRKGGKS